MAQKQQKVKNKKIWVIVTLFVIAQIFSLGFLSWRVASLEATVNKQEMILDSQGQLLDAAVGAINTLIETDKAILEVYKNLNARMKDLWI